MKIVKEEDLCHKIFKDYDKLVNILEIFRFESPEGYMITRRSGSNFAIDIYGNATIPLTNELKDILLPYFKGDLFMSLTDNQGVLREYMQNQNMDYWFSSYKMSTDMIKEMTKGEIVLYNGELERYIHVLGKAFIPLRKILGFEVLDYFESNPDYAEKTFVETNDTSSFYGYVVDKKIIGAAYAYGNEIESIGIDPEFQGHGYGKQLLRGAVQNMLQKYEEVTIGVVEINTKAHKLYESEGFKTISYRHNFKNFND